MKFVDPRRHHLVEVEYCVGIDVLARNCLRPEFLHEEHLVSELRSRSVCGWPCLPDPVRQVTHKVKEKVALWNADHCSAQRHVIFDVSMQIRIVDTVNFSKLLLCGTVTHGYANVEKLNAYRQFVKINRWSLAKNCNGTCEVFETWHLQLLKPVCHPNHRLYHLQPPDRKISDNFDKKVILNN